MWVFVWVFGWVLYSVHSVGILGVILVGIRVGIV